MQVEHEIGFPLSHGGTQTLNIQQFVTASDGGYFFAPSLDAIKNALTRA